MVESAKLLTHRRPINSKWNRLLGINFVVSTSAKEAELPLAKIARQSFRSDTKLRPSVLSDGFFFAVTEKTILPRSIPSLERDFSAHSPTQDISFTEAHSPKWSRHFDYIFLDRHDRRSPAISPHHGMSHFSPFLDRCGGVMYSRINSRRLLGEMIESCQRRVRGIRRLSAWRSMRMAGDST